MRFLTLACALAALLLLALVSSIWFLRAASLPQDRTPVVIELAGQSLRIDSAFVRRRKDLLHRQHDRLNAIHLKDWSTFVARLQSLIGKLSQLDVAPE